MVSPANYNEPAQTVIAGSAPAVERAGAKLKEAGAKRVLPLPVSAPFHCALMEPVKARLEPVLRGISWMAPLRPVVTNVEAKPNGDVGRIVPLLVEHFLGRNMVKPLDRRIARTAHTEQRGIGNMLHPGGLGESADGQIILSVLHGA